MYAQILNDLKNFIINSNVSELAKDTEFFRGADIIVSDDPNCPDSNGWSDYIKVVTPFAREASWVICKVRDMFYEFLDYQNKYYFFGHLAEAANSFINARKEYSCKDLLLAIVAEAERMDTEID